jgi:hypothetical protein
MVISVTELIFMYVHTQLCVIYVCTYIRVLCMYVHMLLVHIICRYISIAYDAFQTAAVVNNLDLAYSHANVIRLRCVFLSVLFCARAPRTTRNVASVRISEGICARAFTTFIRAQLTVVVVQGPGRSRDLPQAHLSYARIELCTTRNSLYTC